MRHTTHIPPLPEHGAVTIEEVMVYIKVKKSALYDWIGKGLFPAPRKLGRRSVWLAEEIRDWLKSQPTAAAIGQGGTRHTIN